MGIGTFVRIVQLGDADSRRVGELIDRLVKRLPGISLEDWLCGVAEAGDDLPLDLRSALQDLKGRRGKPALLVRGLGADDAAIGPTPSHWRKCRPFDPASATLRQEAAIVLLGQFLGDVFGYASLQDGRLIHNLLPIPGAEMDQSGHGSKATLEWHTEDAFTPFRADYLALMGLRNNGGIATTVCGLEALGALDPQDEALLKEARFRIVPDDEHLRSRAKTSGQSILMAATGAGAQIPVLRDDPRGREMVIDSVYMSPVDAEAEAAFRRAGELIAASLVRVPIGAGEVLVLDNRRVVHGREEFRAKFDGTDRWLLKVSITESLHSSAAYRPAPGMARVLQ